MERAELRRAILAGGSAEEHGDFVFLRDPQWRPVERLRADELTRLAVATDGTRGWLCIPTGGSSGHLRFARHDEITVNAAVSGFCLHFGIERVNAVGVLPMHHVSGLMARIRCLATGGHYYQMDWKALAAGDWPDYRANTEAQENWFISLVPTQLQRLLELSGGADFLKQFRTVFIGGGPTWAELENAAAAADLPIALSYGMTETAAMIASQKPSAFFTGERDAGHPLPHVRVEILDETHHEIRTAEVTGRIRVSGESVFRGYFPDLEASRSFETEDLGRWTARGTLRIVGRRDSAIITGGKKVWPIEVEEALRATGAFTDVAVIGVADERWGEAVVACYPADELNAPLERVKQALEAGLAAHKHPKRFIALAEWPRNAQGKLNRAKLKELAEGK